MATAKERAATALALDPDHFKKLGSRGGRAVLKQHGKRHYAALGRKGGAVNSRKGRAHFRALGRKGGARIRELIAAGRAAQS